MFDILVYIMPFHPYRCSQQWAVLNSDIFPAHPVCVTPMPQTSSHTCRCVCVCVLNCSIAHVHFRYWTKAEKSTCKVCHISNFPKSFNSDVLDEQRKGCRRMCRSTSILKLLSVGRHYCGRLCLCGVCSGVDTCSPMCWESSPHIHKSTNQVSSILPNSTLARHFRSPLKQKMPIAQCFCLIIQSTMFILIAQQSPFLLFLLVPPSLVKGILTAPKTNPPPLVSSAST